MNIIIRKCNTSDREEILRLVIRLSEGALPSWRSKEQIDGTNIKHVGTSISEIEEDQSIAIYVAVDKKTDNVIGFMRLQTQVDYFTGENIAYLANIAIDENFEGHGVGRLLMDTAEAWALEKGYLQLALHVFEENSRARKIYEEFGFREDILKYVKPLI